ncbi:MULTISPECIES: phosphate acetyltransferase [unclassified Campylobacter]|uniref:phosphate acetyltransferase n=1 Tax=unclassified Campylobacter TaxID=2593542 RepID=UPI003D3464C2
MNSFYLISSLNLANLKEKVALKFKNFTTFEIKIDENAYLTSKKQEILKLIDKFEMLKREYDFIIVIGSKFKFLGTNETNLMLAKELNCPIFADENLNELRVINSGSRLLITDDLDEILKVEQNITTKIKFEYNLAKLAKKLKKHIILPESEDERILRAAAEISAKNLAKLTLLGNTSDTKKRAYELGLDLENVEILDPQTSELTSKFAEQIFEARKAKNLSYEQAQILSKDRNYFATMCVKNALVDGMVSGAVGTTADTIRPALQLIKTKPGISTVSGLFFMALDEEILLYADCAVTPKPDANTLAQTAVLSAKSAKNFGIIPSVALLSYSTKESGAGESVETVRLATKIINENESWLNADGPLQYDAATNLDTADKKAPGSSIAGSANVFVFPDLNSANICYKAVQKCANALAVGPVLQGLNAPVNDLSRGATVQDIINTILITAIQAGEN